MSKMSEINLDIQEAIRSGELSFSQIADQLQVSLDWVEAVFDEMCEAEYQYDDSMDGDFDSAMASAGFGTDEDYGYYGDEF